MGGLHLKILNTLLRGVFNFETFKSLSNIILGMVEYKYKFLVTLVVNG